MRSLGKCLKNFLTQESGAEPVQYAIALAFIIIVVVGGLRLLGNATNSQNNATSNMLKNAATPSVSS